jgi:hypothetical protein
VRSSLVPVGTCKQAGLVLHPPDSGPDQRGELDDVGPGEVGQGPLEHCYGELAASSAVTA